MRYLLSLLLALPLGAQAFEISTGLSDPCHENVTLGAFGIGEFKPMDGGLQGALDVLVARARTVGVPQDDATQAFIKRFTDEFPVDDLDEVERWVLGSLVIGSREPDTRGLSVASLNDAREIHVAAENQAAHSLRRPEFDGEAGNAQAIQDARNGLADVAQDVYASWNADTVREARWTFAFRGSVDVKVLGAAYDLGRMGHTVQDAYTHMLRDDMGRVVTVLNYADAAFEGHEEHRDGVRHSGRLDQCQIDQSDLDAVRVREATAATIDLLGATMILLMQDEFDPAVLDPILDEIYALRRGCTQDTGYCGTKWLEAAREQPTEPVKLWFCAASPDAPVPWWLLAMLALACPRWRPARRR